MLLCLRVLTWCEGIQPSLCLLLSRWWGKKENKSVTEITMLAL